MDYSIELQNAKQKLFEVGFNEEKYNQLLELAAEELMDNALMDLQEKDLAALEALENKLVEQPTNSEEANRNIQLIFSEAYGEQAEEIRQKMLLDYLNNTIQQTYATKDLVQRYQAGDPTAVAAVEGNKDNPEVVEMMQELEEEDAISNIQRIADDTVEEGWRLSKEPTQQVGNVASEATDNTQGMPEEQDYT